MTDENELNPVRLWREWIVKSEKMWSDAITDVMGNPQVSSGMGRSMQEFLHMHKMFTDSFAQYLSALNLPSRGDILDLSDRIGQLEDAVAAVSVDLREQRALLANAGVADQSETLKKKPKRTRKPKDD
ncbi:MAG: hypothetical protein ACU84Q_02685 [Gammaproteobacteria bacterium]